MGRELEQEEFFSEREVADAIEALSETELLRLDRIARILMGGQLLRGHDHEDLLHEAVTRTLSAARRWKRGIDILHHLKETMRSIASSWRKRTRHEATEADLATDEEMLSPIDRAPAADPLADELVSAREELQALESLFFEDHEAQQVIAGWRMGMTGPEIQETGDLTQREFQAAVRRIRRRALASQEARRVQ